MGSILVIDDEEIMRDSLLEVLGRSGYRVDTAPRGPDGLERFRSRDYDLVITDLKMPGMDGIEVLTRVRAERPDVPVILVTAYATVETAIDAMKQGAFDYIMKPFDRERILVLAEKALGHRRLMEENEFLRNELDGDPGVLVGKSPAMQELGRTIEKYADSAATVLIRGESGTGKELVAREIHRRGPRRNRPFLCVNCAALSAGLLESELFGHERGAFTGAERMRRGRFELADGGVLLLDEVSEIDTHLQAKLLRVLQQKSFERVGSSDPIRVDVRVLATTNRDLEEEVASGRFREDLYFRLKILPIDCPPLRARREDIPLLVDHFLARIHRRTGGPPKVIDRAGMDCLLHYEWPGNVRELENTIERAFVITEGGSIHGGILERWLDGHLKPASVPSSWPVEGWRTEDVERTHTLHTLKRNGWNQRRTAEILGIGVRTLRDKIKRWNLKDGE